MDRRSQNCQKKVGRKKIQNIKTHRAEEKCLKRVVVLLQKGQSIPKELRHLIERAQAKL
jgi:hypothetical protein